MKRILVFGVLAVALTASSCKEKKTTTQQQVSAVAIKVAYATSETVPDNVEFTAAIEPWQKNQIVPALQGARIARVYFDVGDKVRKGQLVAEMDPTQYNTAKVQYDTAEADYRRVKSVYDAGGVSEQVFKQTEAAYLIAKEAFDNVASHVKLYSPVDGVVTARGADAGNLFSGTPILEIMQIDKLKVRINISEQYFRDVRVGNPVSVSVDIFPSESFPASISLVAPAIDPATRTFMAEVTIPNAGGKLRPGMFARATINMGDAESVMVPDVAVQRQIGTAERFVYVIEDGVAHRRVVTIGNQVGADVAVSSGVETGQKVAITSFSRLGEGAEVEITE